MSRTIGAIKVEVHDWLDQLERAVIDAENALRRRAWRDLGEAIAMQRRFTHGLQIALEKNREILFADRDDIDQRIGVILSRRALQLKRLEKFHVEVGRRLRQLSQFKFALREMSPEPVPIALDIET